jgi:Ca-activated chloride channel family protein
MEMKRLIVLAPVLLLLVLALASCGQSAEKLNNRGNEAFANRDFEGSLLAYQQAGEEAPELAEPHYNAANSHYRLEDYEQAQQQIEQALRRDGASQENLDQHSFYNLGNTFFQTEQFETAIEAYKEALRLDPDDLEAKQNLELALRQLQQQQQEQQQDQQDQDQQEQDQQDQQNQDRQNQQNQDEQAQQDQQDQDQQDQRQDGQPQDQEQQNQAGNQPQQTAGLSEEQARQLLAAAAQGTESLEEHLQQTLVFPGAPPMEDW